MRSFVQLYLIVNSDALSPLYIMWTEKSVLGTSFPKSWYTILPGSFFLNQWHHGTNYMVGYNKFPTSTSVFVPFSYCFYCNLRCGNVPHNICHVLESPHWRRFRHDVHIQRSLSLHNRAAMLIYTLTARLLLYIETASEFMVWIFEISF